MIQPRTKSKIRHYFQMHKYFRGSKLALMECFDEPHRDTIPAPPPTEPHNEKPEVE